MTETGSDDESTQAQYKNQRIGSDRRSNSMARRLTLMEVIAAVTLIINIGAVIFGLIKLTSVITENRIVTSISITAMQKNDEKVVLLIEKLVGRVEVLERSDVRNTERINSLERMR